MKDLERKNSVCSMYTLSGLDEILKSRIWFIEKRRYLAHLRFNDEKELRSYFFDPLYHRVGFFKHQIVEKDGCYFLTMNIGFYKGEIEYKIISANVGPITETVQMVLQLEKLNGEACKLSFLGYSGEYNKSIFNEYPTIACENLIF
jgi:hypothetical protein